MDGISRSWSDLHRLRSSFGAARSRADDQALRGVARALGATAVPLCTRELAGPTAHRTWALTLLRTIAQVAGERVCVALRAVAADSTSDEAKLAALALLAELGDEQTTARFADPGQVHKQSLARFASQLATPAEVASAADLLVSRLPPEEIVEFVEAFSEAEPERARQLGDELAARVDLDPAARGELSRVTAPLRLDRPTGDRTPARPLGRPALLTGLRHDDGRVVIAVARRVAGEQRWRSLATLVGTAGTLDEVFYDDDTAPRRVRDALIEPLLADGYARFPITTLAARRLVAAAARRAVGEGRALPSPYYLGRDLLGLADSHLQPRPSYSPDRAALLGRAIDLLAAGSAERARPLLEHCVAAGPDDADALATLGLCRFAQGEFAAAMSALERAVWLEPTWPLHQWNLAAAAHRAGELARCARALRGFLDHAGDPLAAAIDPEHTHRIALARRFLVDHAHLRDALEQQT